MLPVLLPILPLNVQTSISNNVTKILSLGQYFSISLIAGIHSQKTKVNNVRLEMPRPNVSTFTTNLHLHIKTLKWFLLYQPKNRKCNCDNLIRPNRRQRNICYITIMMSSPIGKKCSQCRVRFISKSH